VGGTEVHDVIIIRPISALISQCGVVCANEIRLLPAKQLARRNG